MKPVTPSDLDALASQLERTARVLRLKGREALRRAQDWSGSALRSTNTDPGRGKGQVSDPTFAAALNRDPNADELAFLTVDAGHAFDGAVHLESRVLRISADAVIENQRAGIGHCSECADYMDGSENRRLRAGVCDRCRKRAERKEAKECLHMKIRTHHGAKTCMSCGAELTEAGTVA